MPQEDRNMEDTPSTTAMKEELECPRCRARNEASARFCSQCGLVYMHCPKCDTLNPEAVEFCIECGERIQSSKTSAKYGDNVDKEPYVIWEGFPFAWLERRMQTKRQFFLSLGIYIFCVFTMVTVFMIDVVPAALQGDPGAGAAICCLSSAFVVIGWLFSMYWWVGRREAEEEQKNRWQD